MKAKFGQIEVEGTVEEIALLIRQLNNSIDVATSGRDLPNAVNDKSPSSAGKFVSEEIAFQILKRRPLSSEQKHLLKLLREHEANWTTAIEIQEALGYSRSQLGGMLGAFGKRVKSSVGYEAGQSFFDQEWDYENDCHRYRLPGGVLAAVRRAGI